MNNILWILHDIGHNHQARIAALANSSDVNLTVLTIYKESGFEEFGGSPFSCGSARIIHMGLGRKKRKGDVSAYKKMVSGIVDELKIRVILIPGWGEWFALLALKFAWSKGIGTVIFSETSLLSTRRTWLSEHVKKQLLGGVGGAVVSGREQIAYLESLGVSRKNSVLGYSVVDNDHFKMESDSARQDPVFWRHALKLPSAYFLFCGRLVREKNLFFLIDAFQLFKNNPMNGMKPDLVIMGDGPLRHDLEKYCSQKQMIGSVHFIGFQTYQVLPKVYGLSKGLILPSTHEPWGLVVNEAMASKVPVLVSDRCGCASELVENGVNGFVFDAYDFESLTEILHHISRDVSVCERMGVEGQKVISRWSVEFFAESVKKAVALAVDRPKKPLSVVCGVLFTMAAHR